jgi:hypothetical protein
MRHSRRVLIRRVEPEKRLQYVRLHRKPPSFATAPARGSRTCGHPTSTRVDRLHAILGSCIQISNVTHYTATPCEVDL